MNAENKFDLVVLGSGPGGYVAAIRAAQEGLSTAIVEADRLGGVCLNWGCIPSKALLASAEVFETVGRAAEFGVLVENPAFDWEAIIRRSRQVADRVMRGVRYLMKKNGIAVFEGRGRLAGGERVEVEGEETVTLAARNVILATGARPRQLAGIRPDGENVITSKEALVLQHQPRSIVIVGGGAIGMEFAYFFSTFGTQVTVVELLERVLPTEDEEVSAELQKIYEKRGLSFLTGAYVEKIEPCAGGLEVTVRQGDSTRKINCEKALIAVGVTGNVEGIGLEEAGVETARGFVKVGDGFRTAAPRVRAVGDCIGPPLLAHAASREGIAAVESILGRETRVPKPEEVPGCVYCRPQVASIGLTETRARQAGLEPVVGRFPFRPLGRAVASGEQEGFVKVVADSASGKLLGVHILGAEATELIGEASLARWLSLGVGELHEAVHPHPTFSEALMEAAADAVGRAIHL